MGTVIKEKEVIYSEKFEKWIPKNKLVNYFHKLEQENQELKNELKCTEFKNLVLAKKLGEVKKENQELKKLLGLEKEWTQNNAGVITDFSKVLDERNKELKELKNRYRWRKVEDELSEPFTNVPILAKSGSMYVADHIGSNSVYLQTWRINRSSIDFNETTHWMPLPEVPND